MNHDNLLKKESKLYYSFIPVYESAVELIKSNVGFITNRNESISWSKKDWRHIDTILRTIRSESEKIELLIENTFAADSGSVFKRMLSNEYWESVDDWEQRSIWFDKKDNSYILKDNAVILCADRILTAIFLAKSRQSNLGHFNNTLNIEICLHISR